MNKCSLLRSALSAALLLGSAACITGEVAIGEDEQELVAESPEPRGPCETFCAAAAVRGCPPTGDCVELCELQRSDAPGCGDELDAVLACAPAALMPDSCAVQRGAGHEACEEKLVDYGICLNVTHFAFDLACHPRGASWMPYPDGGLGETKSHMTCTILGDLEVRLDASCVEGGMCECRIDREVAHTCQNLIHAQELNFHDTGCCSRFFEESFEAVLESRYF